MTTSSPPGDRPAPARRPRSFADVAGAMLDATAAAAAPSDAGHVEPGPAAPASSSQDAASATAPAIGGAAGPRLRASERSTLAGGDVRRTVYMPPDLWRDVLRLADGEGVTAAAIVRQAVAEHVERARRRGR